MSMWRHISTLTGATLLSRVLGLARDVSIFAVLGAGAVNSAFILAFTLPNLFRRLLGEGAMTSAVVPVLAETQHVEGDQAFFTTLNQVLTRLFLVLVALVLVGSLGLWLAQRQTIGEERYHLAADYGLVLLPYMIWVCLAAILAAALNVLGHFAVPAFSQIWLNLAMLAGLGVGIIVARGDPHRQVFLLCGGILAGGCLQCLLPALVLKRKGWLPRWDLRGSPRLDRLTRLLIPGLMGAAIFQINILTTRFIGFSLSDDAASLLYLANRLMELPLGVFAVAVSTVLFPDLARAHARGDQAVVRETYLRGLWLMLAINLAAAVGLCVLAEPIVRTLFQYGLFSASDTAQAAGPVAVLALGMPLFAWSAWATRTLHAHQEMRLPMRLAVGNLILNVVLSLALSPWGIVGLAWANCLAAFAQCLFLSHGLRRRFGIKNLPRELGRTVGPLVVGLLSMAVLLFALRSGVDALPWSERWQSLIEVLVGVPVGAAAFLAALWFGRFPELEDLRRVVLRRWPRR